MGSPTPLAPVLSRFWDDPESWTLETYRRNDGYRALDKALKMEPDAVITAVKDSGLRGRGGAGFSTGTKWSFIPQGDSGAAAKPHYLVVNADESEPGTCKDIPLMLATPHVLVEGVIIASYAIRASHAFIYVRGEVLPVLRRLQNAVAEAYANGYLGRNIAGSGYDLELVVHAGAGAYICGEETALLDSLEGRRGQPRLRPPFPAVAGLYGCPTVINNVETIASVPSIILNGVDWFRSMGSEKSPGYTLYSLSGHVTRPGQYEAPLGITLRELLDYAGGVRAGHQLKFWTPGGSSTPLLTDEHLDVPLDYEGVGSAGSMLGTKALEIFDETTCVVRAVGRWIDFYKHESCGKCTPCREGTFWLSQIYQRLEAGHGTAEDLDKLLDISDAILGKSFCALGDGAASPVASSIQFFRDEYVAHIEGGGCPFDPQESMLAADGVKRDPNGRHRKEGHRARAGDADHRRHRNQCSQGNFGDPRGRVDRRADSPVLRPPLAGPGRRVPPMHRRDRGAAQADGVVHHPGRRRHGGPHAVQLGGRRQGAARCDGTAADQPPAGLPDVRQGR